MNDLLIFTFIGFVFTITKTFGFFRFSLARVLLVLLPGFDDDDGPL